MEMEQTHQATETLLTPASSSISHQILKSPQAILRAVLLVALANGCSKPADEAVQDERVSTVASTGAEEPIQYLELEARVKLGQRVFHADQFYSQKISAESGSSLSEFIKGKLDAIGAVPADAPEGTERAYIYGIVELCKKANPGMDLEDFNKINGQRIMFPTRVDVGAKGGLQKSSEALAKLAILDGYPIDKPEKRQGIFNNAIANGIQLRNESSEFAYSRAEGYTESPAFLLPDAAQSFNDLAWAFNQMAGEGGDSGWSIVYTHVLRNTALQSKQPGNMGNAHLTGRAINICNGRYRTPEGEEITWNANPEFRSFIENELHPTLTKLLDESGAAYSQNIGFYDVYFQKVDTVVFKEK